METSSSAVPATLRGPPIVTILLFAVPEMLMKVLDRRRPSQAR